MTDNEQRHIFSQNLTRLIEASGKTQKDIAKIIGVTPAAINTWCKGTAIPRMGKVQRLADYFGVPKSALIDKQPDPQTSHYIQQEAEAVAQELHDNPDLRILFDAARKIPADDMRKVAAMIEAYKKAAYGDDD